TLIRLPETPSCGGDGDGSSTSRSEPKSTKAELMGNRKPRRMVTSGARATRSKPDGYGKADGADEEAEADLLVREDVLDGGQNGQLDAPFLLCRSRCSESPESDRCSIDLPPCQDGRVNHEITRQASSRGPPSTLAGRARPGSKAFSAFFFGRH
ncbi:hypothetical protein VQ042_22635, partial [Aurantimonas sp. A2-1-M11]|uniref:hypothetical protein n=1 Tax=Aurantimonas sp. A2-1-M11 TaxID=3113712 RepID=UPI002F9227DE